MATAQDVANELNGADPAKDVHRVAIWKNVPEWAKASSAVRSLQDKVTRLLREWTEEAALYGKNFDVGREGGNKGPLGPRNALYRVLFETTLWLPRLSLQELRAKRAKRDTMLGHARDAASYCDVIDRKLDKIAEKLGVDLSDVE